MTAAAVSRREFARTVGAHVTTVQRMVARGELPTDGEGKILLAAGLLAWGAIRPPATPAQVTAAGEPDEAAASAPRAAAPAQVIELELERRRHGVRLQALRVGREEGTLVRREDVRAEAEAVLGAVRAAFLSLPNRVSLLIEGLNASSNGDVRAAAIRRVLEAEIDLAFEALYAARHGTAGAATKDEP